MSSIQYCIQTPINEHFEPLKVPPGTTLIDIDLKEMGHINSTGIKTWVEWVEHNKSHSPDLLYNLRNCPKLFIDQVNMVGGFMPERCMIHSFRVPFYSDEHDLDTTRIYTLGQEVKWNGKAWVIEHPKVLCKDYTEMEVDVPDRYFKFLDYMVRISNN
jgi:hypothetical protein